MQLDQRSAHNPWSRWASLLDVERFLLSLASGDHEVLQLFITAKIHSLSIKNCQFDSYLKGDTPYELQPTATNNKFFDEYHY